MKELFNKFKNLFSQDVIIGDVYWADGTKVNKSNKTEHDSTELVNRSEKFLASNLIIKDVLAEVNIQPHSKQEITVKINGPKKYVDNISVTAENNELTIKKIANNNISIGRVVVNGISISGSQMPTITIYAPSETNIDISEIFGDTKIACFTGNMVINSGMGNIDIKKTPENSILNLLGMGNMTIHEFNGDLSLQSAGHGNFRIVKGKIERTTINLTSIGNVTIPQVNGKLIIKSSGHGNVNIDEAQETKITLTSLGNVKIHEINGSLHVENSGHGDIEIIKGKVNDLYVKLTSMGNFTFGGQAENADLNSSGMGDIEVEYVKNRPYTTNKGMGDITVNNW